MTNKLEYNGNGNYGEILTTLVEYLKKQKVQIEIAKRDDQIVNLIKDNNVYSNQTSHNILLELSLLSPKLIKEANSNEALVYLKLFEDNNYAIDTDNDILLDKLDEMLINNKHFFIGKALTFVDIVVYILLYPIFEKYELEDVNEIKYTRLSKFFEQIQLITPVRTSCSSNIRVLNCKFFEKKYVEKVKNTEKVPIRSLDDPSRIELRVGKILSVEIHPTADKLYLEKIDIGEDEPRTILSGLVGKFDLTQKVNEYVIIVANLKPKTMRGITSHGMLLCANQIIEGVEHFEPICVPPNAKVGELITYEGFNGEYDSVINSKSGKDSFTTVQPNYNVDNQKICRYKEIPLMTSDGPLFVSCDQFIGSKLS